MTVFPSGPMLVPFSIRLIYSLPLTIYAKKQLNITILCTMTPNDLSFQHSSIPCLMIPMINVMSVNIVRARKADMRYIKGVKAPAKV